MWSLSISADHRVIHWLVHLPLAADELQQLVAGFYPSAKVSEMEYDLINLPTKRRYLILKREAANFFDRSLTAEKIKAQSDPLNLVVQVMDNLQEGDRLDFALYILAAYQLTPEELKTLLTISAFDAGQRGGWYGSGWGGIIFSFAANQLHNEFILKKTPVQRFSDSETEYYLQKLRHPLYIVNTTITITTDNPSRLGAIDALLSSVEGVVAGAEMQVSVGVSQSQTINTEDELDRADPTSYMAMLETQVESNIPGAAEKRESLSLYLTADELAALWHLPHENFSANRIEWAETFQPIPPALKTLTSGIILGKNGDYDVHLPDEERTQPTIIIGKVGTGKSSLIHGMVHQDIKGGRGVVVIDPHGALIRDIMQTSIPRSRENDVVILDFANSEYPPPLNPLYRPAEMAEDIATNRVMAVMTKIYDDFAFREMAETLSTALATLSVVDNPTLLDIMRVFDEDDYQAELVARLDDFTIKRFWNKFNAYSEAEREKKISPVLRRLNPFYRNKLLRAIACHPQPLNLRQLISDNKIMLVSLAADEAKMPQTERQLLVAVLVSQIQMAAMAGAIKQPPFLLYIDEAQHFVTTALPEMLEESRKQGLGLVLANQYLKQLAGDTLQAVEGTVGTMIAFEVGDPDAQAFAPYTRPHFQVTDLITLGKFKAALSLRYQNNRQSAFTLQTLPPPEAKTNEEKAIAAEREAYLRQKSVENYTPMSYIEVNDWIQSRYNPSKATTSSADVGDDDEFIEPKKKA